jgi:hypothetical protein
MENYKGVIMEELEKIKRDITACLKQIGLDKEISLEEVESEIAETDTAFQSLLLLGILRRIMQNQDDEAAKLFIPSVTAWKNYLPHTELGGLSPAEAMAKYPPGPNEHFFISEMMREYQGRLEAGNNPQGDSFDAEADFSRFQNEYLQRIPSAQVFAPKGDKFLTVQEIIIEERRRAGRPEESIDKIGLQIFSENVAENLGEKAAAIDDRYICAVQEMEQAQRNPAQRDSARVRAIRKQFEQDEPYHRCGPAPHQFYQNYAAAVFLDAQEEKELVLSLLERALSFKPDYEYALTMRRRLREYYNEKE